MKLISLKDGAAVHGVVTRAGMDPEQNFRFVKPLFPHSAERLVHVSSRVIRAARLSLADLTPGVVVKVSVKSSTNRRGEPSWTAASVHLAPNFKPADAEPTHLGVIDAGGVQHLRRGDAWFLENVIPRIEKDKVVVYNQWLTNEAQSRSEQMKPGAIVMFDFDGHRTSSVDLYDPSRLKSGLLVEGLNHLRSTSRDVVASTVIEIMRRGDHAMLGDTWAQLSCGVSDRIIQSLRSSGELGKLGTDYPEVLVEAAFRRLPTSESLGLFPDHPFAWRHAEPAAFLCSDEIARGASLDQLGALCAARGATETLWRLLGKSHRAWIIEQASNTQVFGRTKSSLNEQALSDLLEVFAGEDLCGRGHLIPWMSDSVFAGWLAQPFDESFEPEQELIDALVVRLEDSNIEVPMEVRAWSPPFWDSRNRSDLVQTVDHHYRRLLANRDDERSLALIAEAIGLLLHTYTGDFNDPDRWGQAPLDWIDHVIDIVREFPEIDTEIQTRSAFGTWNRQVGFEGPSRVWIHRDDLAAGWPTFAPNDKLLAIYLRLSRGEAMPLEIVTDDERHPMVRAFLTLIDGAKQDQRFEIAVHAHDLITEAVLKRIPAPGSQAAVSLDELVMDFDRALPRCGVVGSRVQFCEGNHRSKPSLAAWQNGARSQDLTPEMTGELSCHCPRLERARGGYRYSGCPVQMADGRGDARLFARNAIPWTRWTLLELLEGLSYPPNLISFFKPSGAKPRVQTAKIVHNEYVNKVAAVVNRINDLRDRLRCGWRNGEIDLTKGCGKTLSPNFSYRVFPAAYGITVFGDCTSTEAGPHDKSAYFNHCKRCLSIIDSRESPVKDDSGLNTYVCAHCGGWGQEGEGEFLKCGKCGSVESELDGSAKNVTCRVCGHEWRPPDRVWPIHRNSRP